MRNVFLIALLFLFTKHSFSQRVTSDHPYFCDPKPLIISDTLAKRIAVDSIMNSLIGEWELIEIAGGWSKNRKPSVFTKIKFDKNGYTEYWENGVMVSKCYIELFLQVGFFLYNFRDLQGKEFIHLASKIKGRLALCENKLGINNSQGDGEALFFKRLF